jgi:hypothetical protein
MMTPAEKARLREQSGFWICQIEYAVSERKTKYCFTAEELSAKVPCSKRWSNSAPAFSTQGNSIRSNIIVPVFIGDIGGSDSFLIATADGHLYFKYDRALNPQLIGKAEDVLSPGFTYDCTKFKGRAGLPWEREI